MAKLDGVVIHLRPAPITFVGNGIALRYAEVNNGNFAQVDEFDLADITATRYLMQHYDAVLSVMEPHLVFAAVREARSVYFFDSLLGFWLTNRSLSDLADVATTIRTGSAEQAEAAFDRLTVHESMIVCHMIATASYAQSFAGVAQRAGELNRLGVGTVTVTGPMLDMAMIERLRLSSDRSPRTLVANLGGFDNAFLDYAQRGSYVNIILRWLKSMAPTSGLDEIIVCSGAFRESVDETVGGVRFRIGLLPRDDLLQLLSCGPVYLAAPGLTSLYEAAILGLPPMLLPEQHFGHVQNRRRFAGTQLSLHGATLTDVGFGLNIPDDDFDGTMALYDAAAEIDGDPALFNVFADYMNHRLAEFRGLGPRRRRAYVEELNHRLGSACTVPIGRALTELQDRIGDDAAVLPS